jgi:hypothetical protein
MSSDSAWLFFVALALAAGGAWIAWRGYYDFPLYGRIDRATDPVSLWIFVAIFEIFSALMTFAALA